jgi:hypothetical protein
MGVNMYKRAVGFLLFLAAVAVALAPSAGALGAALLSENFSGYATNVSWADGTAHGNWNAVYNGYGVTKVVADAGRNSLQEKPKSSTSPAETHAGLVRSTASYGDSDTTVLMKTVGQLRTPTPNAWEVGWVLWHYTDDTHFYYFTPKPNGWELGKEDPALPCHRLQPHVPGRSLVHGARPPGLEQHHRLGQRNASRVLHRHPKPISERLPRALQRRLPGQVRQRDSQPPVGFAPVRRCGFLIAALSLLSACGGGSTSLPSTSTTSSTSSSTPTSSTSTSSSIPHPTTVASKPPPPPAPPLPGPPATASH